MTDHGGSLAVQHLLGNETLVRGFADDTAEQAADRCLSALVSRYGNEEARRALRAALKRKRMTRGTATGLLMDAMHDVLVAAGARDPTAQVEKIFGEEGPLSRGQQRASIRRRLRRERVKGRASRSG